LEQSDPELPFVFLDFSDLGLLMDKRSASTLNKRRSPANGPTFVFAATYLAQGAGSQFGIIAQPLQFFLKTGQGMSAAAVSSYLAILMTPWVLKPFFGVLCDLVPLFGYRRKSYLILTNLLAACGLVIVAMTGNTADLRVGMLLLAIGVAASTAVTVGLAVEAGRYDDRSGHYFAIQTFCYYCAMIAASVAGGLLCHHFEPQVSLHTAAFIALVPILLASSVTALLLREERAKIRLTDLKLIFIALKEAGKNPALYCAVGFIALWDFSPSFGVPLYFFETNTLHFAQNTIGQLTGWYYIGMALGAVGYRIGIKRMSLRQQLMIAVPLSTLSTLAYLLLSTPLSAVGLELLHGFSAALAILLIYSLAAEACPAGTEVTVMATLIAVRNLAAEGSTFIGGKLYDQTFHAHLAPLIVVAAATTACCALLIPLFPAKRKACRCH
jgi:predicted MFS family arabinose efflux permease